MFRFLSRIDALSLLLVFIVYLVYMFYRSKFSQEDEHQKELEKAAYLRTYALKNCVTISIDDINTTLPTILPQNRRQSMLNDAQKSPQLNAEHNGVNDNDNNNDDDDIDEGVSNSSTHSQISSTLSTLNDFLEDFLTKIEPPKPSSLKNKDGYEPLKAEDEEDSNGFDLTQNALLHFLLFPFILLFNLTMFNRSWAFVNFFFSIFYLSLLSYVTVWAITGLSEQLSIPANIAGMTFLALGSAVPDLVTGIVLIKKTKAISMSLCASLAANVFAILLGLGLPWTTQIAINMSLGMDRDNVLPYIPVESGTLPISCLLLLGTVVLFYFVMRASDWRFSYGFAVCCSVMFVAFITANVGMEVLAARGTMWSL